MKDGIMDLIGKVVPTQRKKIDKFFLENPIAEIELNKFLKMYSPFMQQESISLEKIVSSYLQMVNQFLRSRLEFIRTGSYPSKSQETALNEVYQNKDTMQQYMLGLALSYFLWKHHFQLLTFYKDQITKIPPKKRILEVGCGHGLLLVELLTGAGSKSMIDAVDISLQSINMTKNLLKSVLPQFADKVSFYHCNVFDFTTVEKYDFITIGEVLEHVEKPLELLVKLHDLLAPQGRLFMTTCANCPAVDHVYHFRNIQEIRDLILRADLKIAEELIAPSEEKDQKYLEKHMVDISYAAVLIKKDNTIR